MIGLRFTLARLMAIVLFLGLGFASLRGADALWAEAILDVAAISICTILVGAMVCKGRAYATWGGFLVFTWIDLVIYQLPCRPVGSVYVECLVSALGSSRFGLDLEAPTRTFGPVLVPSTGVGNLWAILLYGSAGAVVGRFTATIQSGSERSRPSSSSLNPASPDGPSPPGPALHKLRLALVSSVISALILGGLWFRHTRVRPQILLDSGIAMVGEWRLDEAIAAFREAIRLRPDYADAHTNLGIALVKQRRPEEAVVALREAIRLNPGDASAHFALGNALNQLRRLGESGQGKLDEVVREYREATRLNPGSSLAAHALGKVLSEEGRFEEAIGAYHDALLGEPKMEIIYYDLYAAERALRDVAGTMPRGASQGASSSTKTARP